MTVTATAPATAFLSTPSARRATYKEIETTYKHVNFYPRPPRGGRHYRLVRLARFDEFLSTPSARRATFFPASCRTTYTDFYPRPPRGGRP